MSHTFSMRLLINALNRWHRNKSGTNAYMSVYALRNIRE